VARTGAVRSAAGCFENRAHKQIFRKGFLKKMNKFGRYSLILGVSLGLTAASYARPHDRDHNYPDPPAPKTAPEVDPSLGVSGLALLGGTLALLRARHRE